MGKISLITACLLCIVDRRTATLLSLPTCLKLSVQQLQHLSPDFYQCGARGLEYQKPVSVTVDTGHPFYVQFTRSLSLTTDYIQLRN